MRSSGRGASIARPGSPSRTMRAGPMCSLSVRQRSEWWPCGRSFPSRERTDRYADAALNAAKTRTTSHYLYVPERAAAERAGKALARAGFRSEAGPASDGDDWLLVATHEAVADKDREGAPQEAIREIPLAVPGTYHG